MFFQDFVLDVILKATVLLVSVSLGDIALRRTTSAGVRHRLWAATFIAILVLPLLSATVPHWRLAILPAHWRQSVDPVAQARMANAVPSSVSLPGIAEGGVNDRPHELHHSEVSSGMPDHDGLRALMSADTGVAVELHSRSGEHRSGVLNPATSTIRDWSLMMVVLFLVGFAVAIAPLILGLLRNSSLGRRASMVQEPEVQQLLSELCQRLIIHRSVRLLETGQSIVPMTWGVFRPVIILPSQWRRWLMESRRLVLLHELAHIKRRDVVYQCVARVACAVLWFHPLIWYALRRLRIERELACDDCVLMAGERPSSYAKQLLEIAREYQSLALPPAVAMAQRSGLEQRVRALLDKARSHVPVSPRVAQILLLGSLMTVTLLAAVHPEAVAERSQNDQVANDNGPQSSEDDSADQHLISGRVLGPNNQPVSGARVVALREYQANTTWERLYAELSETLSAADGTYSMRVPKVSRRFSDGRYFEVQSTHVLASRSGLGPDQRLFSESSGSTDLHLAEASQAIAGQVVDIEGRPLPGVRVSVTEVKVAGAPLDEWLARAAKNPAMYSDDSQMDMYYGINRPKLAVFPEDHAIRAMDSLSYPVVKTDGEGRFQIADIGDDREVTLRIDGESISSLLITAVTREMPTVNMPSHGSPAHRTGKTFGSQFVVSVEPAQIIRGRIFDRMTYEPIAGAIVRLSSYADNVYSLGRFLTTRSNELGEYQLSGVPRAPENSRGARIEVIPPRDLPYFISDELLPKVPGLETIEFDFPLTRGIWIEGRAIDSATGQPVRGIAAYYPNLDNEHAKDHEAFDPGMHTVGYDDSFATDQEGRYRIPALPGSGVVRFVAEVPDSYGLEGPTWGGVKETSDSWKLYHIMLPGNAMVRVNLPVDQVTNKVDVALSPSPSKRFRVIDESGQPVTGYKVAGQFPTEQPTISGRGVRYWGGTRHESEIDVVLGDGKDKERPLMFFHEGRQLGAVIDAKDWCQDTSEIGTITLVPCAKLTGQLVFPAEKDSTGYLAVGYGVVEETNFMSIGSQGQPLKPQSRKRLRYPLIQQVPMNRDGSFSLILPANRSTSVFYGGGAVEPTILDGATLMPGQVLDLGRIDLQKSSESTASTSASETLNSENPASTVNSGDQTAKSDAAELGKDIEQLAAAPPANRQTAVATKQNPAANPVSLNFEGHVVDSNGTAVGGAKLYFLVYKEGALPRSDISPIATTDGDGRFQFQIRLDELQRWSAGDEWRFSGLYAAHAGLGVAGKPAVMFETTGALRNGAPAEMLDAIEKLPKDNRLHLVIDDQPIVGRIVSVDGVPIAGARVRVHEFWWNESGSLDEWEKAAKHHRADYYSLRQEVSNGVNGYQLPSLIPDVQTNSDGRFEVRGLGRERIVELLISGPTIETTIVKTRTRSGSVVKVPHQFSADADGRIETYNPAEFTHVAAPSVPVVGRVTDRKTGDPIAGMSVSADTQVTFSRGFKAYIRTMTDADGRYEIQGLSLDGNDQLYFVPAAGSAYLPQAFRPDIKGRREPLPLDVDFEPAPVVTGRVIDERTGKPVVGAIQFYTDASNPHLSKFGTFKRAIHHEVRNNSDGSFTISAIPGKGYITFNALEHSRYRRAGEALRFGTKISNDTPGIYMTAPSILMAANVNCVSEIDVQTATQNELSIVVRSGEEISGEVRTANGTPAVDCIYMGRFSAGSWSPANAETFSVEAYYEDQPRDLYFYHPATNTAAHLRLEGKVSEPLVVELRSAATIRGRLLDKTGLPVAGVPIRGENIVQAILGRPELEVLITDDKGRFEIPGIVPGQSYSGFTFIEGRGVPLAFKDVVVEKAEVKDLGDITLEQ